MSFQMSLPIACSMLIRCGIGSACATRWDKILSFAAGNPGCRRVIGFSRAANDITARRHICHLHWPHRIDSPICQYIRARIAFGPSVSQLSSMTTKAFTRGCTDQFSAGATYLQSPICVCDLIMSIYFNRVSVYPCFILYILSKWDQKKMISI